MSADLFDNIEPDDEISAGELVTQLAAPDDLSDADEFIATIAPPTPIGRSWAFDFLAGEFELAGGAGPIATNGQETLNQWIEKCLRTARGAHPIHPYGYGADGLNRLIGQVFDTEQYATLERIVTDALLFHPRITEITDFQADPVDDDEGLFVSLTVVLDDGNALDYQAVLR